MNVLIDEFPTAVEIDDEVYELNTNFRDGIEVMIIYENDNISESEKALKMLKQIYKRRPSNIEEAVKLAIKFLDCGREPVVIEKYYEEQEVNVNNKKNYSFVKDAEHIYNAIKNTHGIDLEDCKYMHWWKFWMLLSDLKECFFTRILHLRYASSKGKLTNEERLYWYENREVLDLNYIPEEKREKSNFDIALEKAEREKNEKK